MAYDEYLADRIRNIFLEKKADFTTRKMMGGLCFMVDEKMCCGIHFDKKHKTDLLMARIGEDKSLEVMEQGKCLPMDFTGRPMKGYVFVKAEDIDMEEDLEFWIDLCLQFNPLAKSSKKKLIK